MGERVTNDTLLSSCTIVQLRPKDPADDVKCEKRRSLKRERSDGPAPPPECPLCEINRERGCRQCGAVLDARQGTTKIIGVTHTLRAVVSRLDRCSVCQCNGQKSIRLSSCVLT